MRAVFAEETTANQPGSIGIGGGPVVVLCYELGGVELLAGTLAASSSLACTSGTGILPLCRAALAAWQRIEGRPGQPSALAVKSVRALVDVMATVIRTTTGARRWCETASVQSAGAEAFLQVIPTATFLCLHRALAGVLKDASRSYPWGLGGSPFWPYAVGHQGNNVATVGAYWAASAQALLDFEARYPESCLRVQYEVLAATPDPEAHRIFAWLGLDQHDIDAHSERAEPDRSGVPSSAKQADPQEDAVPTDRLPPPLLDELNRLHRELGYRELN